jgi:hypothetical protein
MSPRKLEKILDTRELGSFQWKRLLQPFGSVEAAEKINPLQKWGSKRGGKRSDVYEWWIEASHHSSLTISEHLR